MYVQIFNTLKNKYYKNNYVFAIRIYTILYNKIY